MVQVLTCCSLRLERWLTSAGTRHVSCSFSENASIRADSRHLEHGAARSHDGLSSFLRPPPLHSEPRGPWWPKNGLRARIPLTSSACELWSMSLPVKAGYGMLLPLKGLRNRGVGSGLLSSRLDAPGNVMFTRKEQCRPVIKKPLSFRIPNIMGSVFVENLVRGKLEVS